MGGRFSHSQVVSNNCILLIDIAVNPFFFLKGDNAAVKEFPLCLITAYVPQMCPGQVVAIL